MARRVPQAPQCAQARDQQSDACAGEREHEREDDPGDEHGHNSVSGVRRRDGPRTPDGRRHGPNYPRRSPTITRRLHDPPIATLDTAPTPRLAAQRRGLPDQPGVYLFRDARRKVIYVGKAKSIRKRVGSHFSKPGTRGAQDMVAGIDSIEFIVTQTEAEAFLAEQNFIKQYKPRFNIRLRDDKSYPYIAISLDEDYPRVYFTRERHRRERAYFGPFSNAKRVRETLDLLGKVFQYRTCDGPEPGRASGSPCLDYFIKRCGAPCVGYVSKEEYRRSIDAIVDFLSGHYRQIERELERDMQAAAAAHEFEQAAAFRNKLKAVRSLLERQRVANEAVGTVDAIAVAAEGTDANAQVFQIRDGVLADRQSFYLENEAGRDEGEVVEEFVLQYYATSPAIPPQVLVPHELEADQADTLAEALAERRGGAVEIRTPERGDKRRILELAERNARLALDQDRLRSERRRTARIDALEGLQEALGLPTIPMRIECFDISNLGETHAVASMVVFEGGAPKKSDYRRFGIREAAHDDFAAMNEVLSRRMAQYVAHRERSPHEKSYDASFATAPGLIVIDGGKGQLSAGLDALTEFLDLGVTVVSLAKRIEEVFLPGRPQPLVLPRDGAPLHLLQRIRDEAHRFAIEFHRGRRDKAMTRSILDDLPGVGPARKRLLLNHFGSPERFLAATRDELESVPGLPGKVAREIHWHLRKAA
jgi:excinuclease ABC subunit C